MPGAVGFEGGLADPGDLGGLLRGESLDVTQHEGGPQRGWQLGQGPARRSSLFSACRDGSRAAGAGNCSSSAPITTPAGHRDLRSSARLASLTAIRYSQVK